MRAVEVWQVDVSPGSDAARRRIAATTGAERERAAGLRPAGHSERWLAARGALRTVLGGRLGVAPVAVEFTTGPHGKPGLLGAELQFNLSHAGDIALIAVADVEVGVDVERLARSARAVARALTDGERAALGATPPELRAAPPPHLHLELLRIWCRKEALAKAMGTGLGWAPERFDTSSPGGYWLADVPVAAGYVAALAVAGGEARIEMM